MATKPKGVQHPLISWLRYRTTSCTELRVHAADDTVTTVTIDRGAKQPFRKAALVCLSYQPRKVEALTKAGKVVDCWTADEGEDEAPPAAEPEAPSFTEDIAARAPVDAESARVILFAKLLADAYKHSTQIAFTKLAEITQQANERAAALERTLTAERTANLKVARLRRVVEREAPAEPEGMTSLEQLASVFMTSALAKQGMPMAAPTNGTHGTQPAPPPEEEPEGDEDEEPEAP